MGQILVIEDDVAVLEAFGLWLADAGFKVSLHQDSKCLENLEKVPDLILLDMLLSGEDGKDVCRKIKGAQSTKRVPVIMVSAHPDAKQRCLEAGADEFLAKPFDIDELFVKIKKHLPS